MWRRRRCGVNGRGPVLVPLGKDEEGGGHESLFDGDIEYDILLLWWRCINCWRNT